MNKLRAITFKWNKDKYPEKNFDEGKQIGLIAQEVEEVVPEIVRTDADGYKSIDYSKLSVILLEAVKDLQKTVSEQQELIEKLLNR